MTAGNGSVKASVFGITATPMQGVEGGDQAVAMQRADGRWRIARSRFQLHSHVLVC